MAKCPTIDLSPCTCSPDDHIICSGETINDLRDFVERLSKSLPYGAKNFRSLSLDHTSITEIGENAFMDITFDKININSNKLLSFIHENAFFETDKVTKELDIYNNPKLTNQANSIFKALDKFIVLETLELYNNDIDALPFEALKSNIGYQDTLKRISLGGSSYKKLGRDAFSSLRNLTTLSLFNISLDQVSEYTFEFGENSDVNLTILFDNVSLAKFTKKSFLNIKRTTNLVFESNVEYMDQAVFEPYLVQNSDNIIMVEKGIFNCSDCRNRWLKKKEFANQTQDIYCGQTDKKIDQAKFADCDKVIIDVCRHSDDDGQGAIICDSQSAIDSMKIRMSLLRIADELGPKFKSFYLNKTLIEKLEDNTLDELLFDEIIIENNANLQSMSEDTFSATNLVTTKIRIQNNMKLTSNGTTLFRILSKFTKLEELLLQNNKIENVPANAFTPINGYQDSLIHIYLGGVSFNYIGSDAFFHLRKLALVQIQDVSSCQFQSNAFRMTQQKSLRYRKFVIDLSESQLGPSNFAIGSLSNIGIPASLKFPKLGGSPTEQILNVDTFKPFLSEDGKTTIDMNGQYLNCTTCDNVWLVSDPNGSFRDRIKNARCPNGLDLGDRSHFKHCD